MKEKHTSGPAHDKRTIDTQKTPMMLSDVVSRVWLGSHTALLEVQEVAFLA